jgi:integrase
MGNPMKLTKANLANLTRPEGKTDYIVFDDDPPGFGVRLRESGRATFIVQYRIGKRQRRMVVGRVDRLELDEARKSAKKLLAQVELGADPQGQKAEKRVKADITLAGVLEAYLEAKSALRPNTLRMNRYYLRQVWAPLHKLPIGEVSRADIATRVRKIATDHGPGAAARARATLSALFTWAMKEGYPIEQNTVIFTNTPDQSPSRDRILSNEELSEIWQVSEDSSYGRIVRLLICTGARRQEVGSMRWNEIQDGIWTIPGSRTKNKRAHSIPILGLAADIIASTPRQVDRDHLFGVGPNGFRNWGQGGEVLRGRLESIPHWTLHDIRRTVATRMADIGIEPHIIEACLNHQSGHKSGVAGIYNRSRYEAGIRAAFERWDAELHSILRGERKVVPLQRA